MALMSKKKLPEVIVIILMVLLIALVVKVFDRKLDNLSTKAGDTIKDSTNNKNNTK